MSTAYPVNTPEFNKAFIINHFEEFVNKKNSAIALVNLSEDFLDHDEAGGPAIGPLKAKQMMEGMYKFLPDLHVSIEDIIAEGDKVMVRNIWSGTKPGGTKIQFKGFVLWKLKDGKIVERWATVTAPYPVASQQPEW
jgi:predicted SnoaL-like aldol condensation-catalyzing enzyme